MPPPSLQFQQIGFGVKISGIAAEGAVGGDDPMTGDKNGEGIGPARRAVFVDINNHVAKISI